tara:strand:+ start:3095 stop:4072 length:978 start_codon:yes stop_codon:yes gene_type:complete
MKFIGNKKRLAHFLKKEFFEENFSQDSSALDLFSGTGSVSEILSNLKFSVSSVDVMKVCYYLTYSKLFNSPKIKKDLHDHLLSAKSDGFITKNFSEKNNVNIFTEETAMHIDGCLDFLKKNKNKIDKNTFSFLMATLIEEADFRSNIMGSYESFYKAGWRKQARKPWSFNIKKNITSTKNLVINTSIESFFENNKNKYDLVYADPPYTARQYSSVFHTLESISTFYNGEVKGKVNKPIKAFNSGFSSKRLIENSFENLFFNVSLISNTFFLSYSNEGIMNENKIIKLGEKYFKKITKIKVSYRRFNTNQKGDQKKVYEYLFKFKK